MVALLMVAMSITEVPTITKTSAITMVSIAKKRAAIGFSSPLVKRQSSDLAPPIP
jgi:hypothetical protein